MQSSSKGSDTAGQVATERSDQERSPMEQIEITRPKKRESCNKSEECSNVAQKGIIEPLQKVHKGIEQTTPIQPPGGDIPGDTREQIWTTLYGQCMGDAIGLLSEFMSEVDAVLRYGGIEKLQYKDKSKSDDDHRNRWKIGDWTDDSDQMILIMQSIVEKDGAIDPVHYAGKLVGWKNHGFEELGDHGGLGIGFTTYSVLRHPEFLTDPHKVAESIWEERNRTIAPNGGVMRTSILGIHDWWDEVAVERNAVTICKVTHRDPRCLASVVAVCLAISRMLQGKHYDGTTYDVPGIIEYVLAKASTYLDPKCVKHKEELEFYLKCENIKEMELAERNTIGYTFKCMGAGFWALKQNEFRPALQQIVLCGGDADTNGAVAGALLGCKLRKRKALPKSWTEFKHKKWLDEQINRYLKVLVKRHKE